MNLDGFVQANDPEACIEVRVAPDGRSVRLRTLPIGGTRNPFIRLWHWIRRRPQYSACWFLQRLESNKAGDLVDAIGSFWIAVSEPQLKYLTPEETLDVIAQFFRGGSLDERATPTGAGTVQAEDRCDVNWTALYSQYAALYGVPDPSTPWTRFLVLSNEIGGQDARARLQIMDSVYWGAARSFASASAIGLFDHERMKLQRLGDVTQRQRSPGIIVTPGVSDG